MKKGDFVWAKKLCKEKDTNFSFLLSMLNSLSINILKQQNKRNRQKREFYLILEINKNYKENQCYSTSVLVSGVPPKIFIVTLTRFSLKKK